MLEEEAKAFIFGERSKFASPGVVGGGDGALNKFSYEHQNEFKSPPLASKMVNISLFKGKRYASKRQVAEAMVKHIKEKSIAYLTM